MMWILKSFLVLAAVLIATACFVIPFYLSGYISREMVVSASPDGKTEAVCRGWYPHGLEYELWLRKKGEWFGQKIGPVGTESMGRCASVAWSPDGTRIAASTTSGHVTVFDARAAGVVGFQNLDTLAYRDWTTRPYTTPRMVTGVAFDDVESFRVATCDRLWYRTQRTEDGFTCGSPKRTDVVGVQLERPRGLQLCYAVNRSNRQKR